MNGAGDTRSSSQFTPIPIRVVAHEHCHIGENPLWNSADQRLYWLDIARGIIYRCDPATGNAEQVYEGAVAGGFTLQADGALLIFGVGGAVLRWHDGALTTVIDGLPGETTSRFNDVIADPVGRILAGTVPYGQPGTGRLYRIDTDGSVTALLSDRPFPNGLGFSPDHTYLYHADSLARTITRWRYDITTGSIADGVIFARLSETDGLPDGLTVDADGCVWLAVWDGQQIIRFAPDGSIKMRLRFPTRKISSLTFGGDGLDDLYVTSAGGDAPAENDDLAGALFHLRVEGVRGLPESRSRFPISG